VLRVFLMLVVFVRSATSASAHRDAGAAIMLLGSVLVGGFLPNRRVSVRSQIAVKILIGLPDCWRKCRGWWQVTTLGTPVLFPSPHSFREPMSCC